MIAPTKIIQDSPPGTSYGFGKCCEAVRDAVPLEKIARRYTDLEPFGGKAWFVGRCALPDHEDKTPSFYIYPPGRWHCYGCGRDGDVVDLEFHCGDYDELWEAMISLAVEHGVDLPQRPERWHGWNARKAEILDVAQRARSDIRRRRLFKCLVLSGPEFEIEDTQERRDAVARAWEIWTDGMGKIGL